jgi:putative OPT family oligopeptide transporter
MSSHETPTTSGLPSNAYTELKPGEEYKPILSPHIEFPEVTPYSVFVGIIMAIIFSAAAAYLGLKVGQVFEAAIPIAILAVGITNMLAKKNGMGQNVIIQSIGSSSGAVVAGAIFTLPGIYILGLQATFYQMFFASLFGGFLGILFLVPFRKYFVSEMHGKLPFPEGTATTEILVAGEKGGAQALVLVISGLIGGIYDFVVATFGTWAEIFTSRVIGVGEIIADKYKMVFRLNTSAAVVGLGYVIGLKYSTIIVAGSFLSYFVFVPLIYYFGNELTVTIGSGVTLLVKDMTAEQIFRNYVRHIGIGAIAMAGFIGIVRSSKVIRSAFSLAVKEIFGGKTVEDSVLRTQRDLAMRIIVIGTIATALAIFIFFLFGVVSNLIHALIGLLIVMIMSFLFTTVAANAIAITGNNPVSGMTLMTLVLSSIILVSVGLSGPTGMVSALIIGGVVCTALSVAGSFVTDLKIGYWLGSSPHKQERWKFVGVIISAATVVWIISLLSNIYGFTGEGALPAPQANAMAAIIQPLMSNQPAPWMLYIAGAVISLILASLKVPVLAFALGMYLPQEINTPLLIGGMIAHFVSTRSKDEEVNNARRERGTLIASGFIAGGALMGVVSVIIRSTGANWLMTEWMESNSAEVLSFVMFCLLCLYTIWDSMRAKN